MNLIRILFLLMHDPKNIQVEDMGGAKGVEKRGNKHKKRMNEFGIGHCETKVV